MVTNTAQSLPRTLNIIMIIAQTCIILLLPTLKTEIIDLAFFFQLLTGILFMQIIMVGTIVTTILFVQIIRISTNDKQQTSNPSKKSIFI